MYYVCVNDYTTLLNYEEYLLMDANEYAGSGGAWLKADALKGQTVTLKITDVEAITFDNEKGKETKLGLSFEGKDQGIIANRTNVKILIETLGTGDTDKWIGKNITAAPNQTPLGLGFALRGVTADFDDDITF